MRDRRKKSTESFETFDIKSRHDGEYKKNIFGIKARGRKGLQKHLKGGRLTFKQAIIANCYDCMGLYRWET